MQEKKLEEKISFWKKVRKRVYKAACTSAMFGLLGVYAGGCCSLRVIATGGPDGDTDTLIEGCIFGDTPIAQLPRKPNLLQGNDPATIVHNENEQNRYDCERAHYNAALEAYREGQPIPPRLCRPFKQPDPELQKAYEKEISRRQLEREKTIQKALDLKRAIDYIAKLMEVLKNRRASINFKPIIKNEPVIENKPEIKNEPKIEASPEISAIDADYVKDFNRKKQAEYGLGNGLSLQEQEAICNRGNHPPAELIGTVEFNDCASDPVDKKEGGVDKLVNKIKRIQWNNIILYCGNASEPLASKCPSETEDYGNLQLTWDRAKKLADHSKDKAGLNGLIQIVYANGARLDERSVRVYLVRNAK